MSADFKKTQVDIPETDGRTPSFAYSVAACLAFLIIVCLGLVVFKVDTVVTAISGLVVVVLMSRLIGYKFADQEKMMMHNVWRTMPAMFILASVGVVVGSWIAAGTIPALIYYGLKVITPTLFLPLGLILCSVMSMAVGSSWGTVSTLGIVFMGIGASLNIPPAMTAGMVISGALFGDKMSPISDSTNLAPVGSGTDLFAHIHAMQKTTIPTYLVMIVVFVIMGLRVGDVAVDMETIDIITSDLADNFNINIITLLPIVVMVTLSVKKFHPLVAMYSGVFTGALIAIFVQGESVAEVFTYLNYGFKIDNVNELIAPILNRGGLQSMMWTFSLAMVVISLAGVLQGVGYLNAIVEVITKKINRPAPMIVAAIITAMFITAVTGDSYSAILLTGTLFASAFDRINLDRSILSRCTEEGGTLFVAIVPWATSGAYFTGLLGVPTLEYLPFTIIAWLNPIISILLAFMGKALIFRDADGNKIEKTIFGREKITNTKS